MNVVRLPPVEPWPTELFETFSTLDLEALIDGAHAEIVKRRSAAAGADVDTCSDCGDAVHPGESICAACGAPHVPTGNTTARPHDHLDGASAAGQKEAIVMVKDCTCGARGICTACVLESYEPSIEERLMVSALDATDKALARIPLHSVRVQDREPTEDEVTRRGPYLMDGRSENDWSL